MPSQRKTTAPSPQQALSGQGVPRIPGKYAIAEGCCRKIQNGPSMVLRLGTLNVGSLTGRSMEIAEILERRKIDICCLQETRWKSNGVCHVNSDKEKYKLFWNGQKTAKNDDLNGHVGEKTDCFNNVHGGFGYGKRNEDGNRILEFAESHGFCLLNTYFRKRLEHLITYKSGPSATQIDFFAVKQPHRRLFKNVKVIPGESCAGNQGSGGNDDDDGDDGNEDGSKKKNMDKTKKDAAGDEKLGRGCRVRKKKFMKEEEAGCLPPQFREEDAETTTIKSDKNGESMQKKGEDRSD
ncbi:hypothetical protein HELRODRAFT_158620 [Helobdella robusta]|uniref:Endonuclease/exonuclease/phosphatase domain-containing protein n=1 Tax=Helobdella robusta TaxID=6412 RepID=T1EN06_HELRO|nr:hypothetical protein HELRODRAFT_158620 [Helobdella robusta]ESO12155.1 hypothetical protein HELRODRAFT_158620 [Helobdella robusta]